MPTEGAVHCGDATEGFFAEPGGAKIPETTEQIVEQVNKLRKEFNERADPEVQLTGHIIQVSHHIPFVATVNPSDKAENQAIYDQQSAGTRPSIEQALPNVRRPETQVGGSTEPGAWNLKIRRGHTAMNSGIEALTSVGFTQTYVGQMGDVHRAETPAQRIDLEDLKPEELASLKQTIEERTAFDGKLNFSPVFLTNDQDEGHYEGYCKTILWPLMHYLQWQDIPTNLDQHTSRDYDMYYEVNMAFAKKIAETWKPGDLVMLHDYHLLLVPQLLRQLVKDPYILLFLHCPFPSSEIFRCLPRRKEILDGMLGANVVTFQMYSYSRHFVSSCIRVCGYESTPNGVDHSGFVTAVSHCPIGVEPSSITTDRDAPGVDPKIKALKALYAGKKLIIGRDKLDEVKGVVQKLQGFQHLLRRYPQWRNNVVMIQVSSPTQYESAKLEATVSDLVSQINGEFGSLNFSPVHHYHQMIDRDEYFALFSVADVGFFNCIRDGMNSTAMEFVLCQETSNKCPLILSEFMGTAAILKEALHVNPWDVAGIAFSIDSALTMSAEERARRQEVLFKRVNAHTSKTWAATLARELLTNVGSGQMRTTPELNRDTLKEHYAKASKRLLMFDYDGTLTPIVSNPEDALPSNKLLECLPKLCEDPNNVVFIISGREGSFLEAHLGHIPNLGMSAEHGCFIKRAGTDVWANMTDELDMSWMEDVMLVFQYYTERTSGSFIERKKSSITWHYRNTDPEFGAFQCKQCHDLLESNIAPRKPVEVLVGKKNLEVRPSAVNKGEIARSIVQLHPDADFIMCAGDDKTDEDMFRALATLPYCPGVASLSPAITPTATFSLGELPPPPALIAQPEDVFAIAVGPPTKKTLASWHVLQPTDLIDLMEQLVI